MVNKQWKKVSICSVTFLARRQNREKSTKFVADSPQIVPINTFVNVNHALFFSVEKSEDRSGNYRQQI